MTTTTRDYTDAGATTRQQHVDNRSVGGTSGDLVKVQETGGQLDFGGGSTGNAINAGTSDTWSSVLSCDGFETIVLKIETSKASPNVEIRVWLGDGNATQGWTRGEKITVKTSNKQGGGNIPATLATGYRHAEPVSVPTLGAKSFKVELVTVGQGNVHVWADAR